MSTVIDTITIERVQATYEVTLLRADYGSLHLAVYEQAQGVGKASEIERINLDKNPELFDLYSFKNRQFRKGRVNDLLKAIEESRELECSTA